MPKQEEFDKCSTCKLEKLFNLFVEIFKEKINEQNSKDSYSLLSEKT